MKSNKVSKGRAIQVELYSDRRRLGIVDLTKDNNQCNHRFLCSVASKTNY